MISAYAITNSCLYTWVFWGNFNINILQFTSVTDLIPSILYILAVPSISMLICSAFLITWMNSSESIANFLYRRFPKSHLNFEFIVASTPSFIFAVLSLALVYYNYHMRGNGFSILKDSVGSIVIFFIFLISSSFSAFLIDAKTNFLHQLKDFRSIMIIIIFLIPPLSYVTAIVDAKNIINGLNSYLIATDSQCSKNPNEKFRYITSVSNKAFALSLTDGSICVFSYNYLKLTPEINKNYELKIDTNTI